MSPAERWPAHLPEPEALSFGRYLAPFVVVAEHDAQQGWLPLEVLPRHAVRLDIASGGLQYGLSVFEGLKAYRDANDGLHLFRPDAHCQRLAHSARQLHLPVMPDELLMSMMRRAVDVHRDHVPPHRRGALYLRPTLYALEEGLGLKASARHALCIVATPCSATSVAPARRLWAERELIRAAPGGLGTAKTAANYAASMLGAQRARARGYDDALWLDAAEHRYLAEAGTMNLFIVLRDRVLTPPLDACILAGITRDSVLRRLADRGVPVEQRPIALDDLLEWQSRGELLECFGSGTAAGIAPIAEIGWDTACVRSIDTQWSTLLARQLADDQNGVAADAHGWRVAV